MVKAAVFDLDDTLISEKEYIKSGYKYISKILSDKYRIKENQIFEDLMDIFNQDSKNVFNRLLEKYQINYTKEEIVDLVNEYRNHYPSISFFEDVIPCIEYLKTKDIRVGIITDGFLNSQKQKLKAVNAYKYFDEIIITDELGREFWKPHPKSFEIMKEKLNVNFNEMIYVGDNPAKDFYIRKTYPIITVRIQSQGIHQEKSYLEGIKEVHTIYRFEDLKKLVNISDLS